jgi:hypothetical protein
MPEIAIPSAASEAEIGALARLPGAILSPGPTFASIARRPTWLAPLLLWTGLSLVVTAILLPRVDYERMVRSAFERRGQTVSEEQIQTFADKQKKIAPVLYNAIATVSPTFVSMLVAVVLWGCFKAFGWDVTFGQSFGATTHAFLPDIFASLLLIPILLKRETVDPQALGDLLRSNLGFLVERDLAKVAHALLQSVDIFSIWSLILFSIGFSAAAKVSRKQAGGVVVTLWLLYVLGKAGLAALF